MTGGDNTSPKPVMEPIQDDPTCPTCGNVKVWPVRFVPLPNGYIKNETCNDPFHGEPIQDDIETVRSALEEWTDEYCNPTDPSVVCIHKRAIAALDRLVAERDQLIEERQRRLLEAGTEYIIGENERLMAERDRLIQALQFYADMDDVNNYVAVAALTAKDL